MYQCISCRHVFTTDEIVAKQDEIGDLTCLECGSPLEIKNDFTPADVPDTSTWTVNPSGRLQKPVSVKITNLARFIGE